MKWKKDSSYVTVAIVPCTSQKSEVGGPAREVWIGGHFNLVLAYAEHFFDKIYIMSYKYGLITPDFFIEPYDIDMRIEKAAERIKWWYMMAEHIEELVDRDKPDLIGLFTGQFERSRVIREFIRDGCRNVIVPFEGKGTGERQQAVYDGEPPFNYEKLEAGDYALPEDYKVINPQSEYKKNRANKQPAGAEAIWEDEAE